MKRIVGIALLSLFTLQCKTGSKGGDNNAPAGGTQTSSGELPSAPPQNTHDAVSQIQSIASTGASGTDCTGANAEANKNACELLSSIADPANTQHVTEAVEALPQPSDGSGTPTVAETGLTAVQDAKESTPTDTTTAPNEPAPAASTPFTPQQDGGIVLMSLSGLAIVGGGSAAVVAFASSYHKLKKAISEELWIAIEYAKRLYPGIWKDHPDFGHDPWVFNKAMKITGALMGPSDAEGKLATMRKIAGLIPIVSLSPILATCDAYARLQAYAQYDDSVLENYQKFRDSMIKKLPKTEAQQITPTFRNLNRNTGSTSRNSPQTRFQQASNFSANLKNKVLKAVEPHAGKVALAGVSVALLGALGTAGGAVLFTRPSDAGAHLTGTSDCDTDPTGIACTLSKLGSLGLVSGN